MLILVVILFIGNDPSSNTGFSNAERNISVGLTALENITTGDDNVAIGYDALQQNETGSSNTAMGAIHYQINQDTKILVL